MKKKKKQLEAIKDYEKKKQLGADSKLLAISYFNQLGEKAKELYERIIKEKNDTDPEKFVCVKTDGTNFTLINLTFHWIWLQIFIGTINHLKLQKINNTK